MATEFRAACVTGGAGFIGQHLVRTLLDRGIAVTVLDDLSVGQRANVPREARLVVGDILDPEAIETALTGADILFHLAARVAIRSSFEFAAEDARVNAAGTASVVTAAVRLGDVRRVIATSSMAVYADSPDGRLVAETHPTSPTSPYGISKLAAERLTHLICARAGISSCVLRLFNTYGRGQALSPYVGVVTIFANQLRAGQRPTIFGDGGQCRDFVHVDDVVQGFLRAMDAATTGESINIGSGEPVTVNQVFDAVRRAVGSDLEPVRAPPAEGELRNSVADIGKARRDLGYSPQHRFATALADVVSDIAPR